MLGCHVCGQWHDPAGFAPEARLLCARCDTPLPRRGAPPDTILALVCTGLYLAVPALLLPIVTVAKFSHEREGLPFSGVVALWHDGRWFLSLLVLGCGLIAPLVVLLSLGMLQLAVRRGWRHPRLLTLLRLVHALEQWSMPEVRVLAFMVAFVKLSALVEVQYGPGLWCYGALSLIALAASRLFDPEETALQLAAAPSAP